MLALIVWKVSNFFQKNKNLFITYLITLLWQALGYACISFIFSYLWIVRGTVGGMEPLECFTIQKVHRYTSFAPGYYVVLFRAKKFRSKKCKYINKNGSTKSEQKCNNLTKVLLLKVVNLGMINASVIAYLYMLIILTLFTKVDVCK